MEPDPKSQGGENQVDPGGGAQLRDVHVEGGDFVGRDKYVYSRSEREELDEYLARAVAAYEGEKGLAVLQLPTRFDDPYKFLDAFSLEDRHRFFGRDDAQQKLYEKVLQDRLTVVHAKSGAGKTSLLNAGLAPRLIGEGRLPVYARAHQERVDAIKAIKQAIAAHAPGPWPALLSRLTLHEFLKATCAHLSRRTRELVLILDQFEEFFIFFPERVHRQPFIDELADCYEDGSLPLRIVIALRKDYYSDLADFEERIPTILGNQYRLEAMTREEARAAITQPLTRLDRQVAFEEALLGALLDDLARGGMELPHLQIVCTQLWRELEDGEMHLTLASYEALGRAPGILSGYLKGELAKLPGKQGRLAREVLKELVSSEATKRVLSHTVLAARIEAEAGELDRVLAWLVNRRLLHRDEDEDEGEVRYEMAHEYLIEEIKGWIEPADLALKQAQELLAGEVASWRVHGTLIPRDRLELLYGHRERLRGLDDESWACILSSAVEADLAVEDWAALAGQAGEKPLVASLDDAPEKTRRAAIRRLGLIWDLEQVSQLGDDDPRIRGEAAAALGELGDTRAVKPLIATLRDPQQEIRRAATRGLGLIWGLAEVSRLGGEVPASRQSAAFWLGELGDARAVEPLIAALGDEDDGVRERAAGALGALGDARAVAPLIAVLRDDHWLARDRAVWALVKLGEPAVAPLIAALEDEDGVVRWEAASALGELGELAVGPLVAALGHGDGEVRWGAARALGALGDPRAVEPLIAVLRDREAEVRHGAARALGKLNDTRTVAPLISALGDNVRRVRWAAATALGGIGDRRAVEPLIVAIQDEERVVREGAAVALGKLGDSRAVEPLIAALEDEDGLVRRATVGALGKLGDPRAVEPLIAALRDKDSNLREGAAWALGELGDPHAVEPLIGALQDEDDHVRQEAAAALESIGTPEAWAALEEAES